MERPLTAQEAAVELGYNVKHYYRLLRNGTIQAERFNHVWMKDLVEVERVKPLQGPSGRLPKRVPEQ